jgi:hypothetical protein
MFAFNGSSRQVTKERRTDCFRLHVVSQKSVVSKAKSDGPNKENTEPLIAGCHFLVKSLLDLN